MIVKCPKCGSTYRFNEERLEKPGRFRVKCKQCEEIMTIDVPSPAGTRDTEEKSPVSDSPSGEKLFEKIRSDFDKLYPMPHVMLKARNIISDPNSNFSQISKILKTDQALASRILRVTNSAYYGLPQKVSTIENAAVLLGTRKIIQIINMLSHSQVLKSEMKGYGMGSGKAWRHSLTVAVGSDIIAKRIAPNYSGEAFLSGLLHDSGKILLDGYLAEKGEAFQDVLRDPDISIVEAENRVLGLDHARVGGALCRQWNMPDFVSDAVEYHHKPGQAAENLLAYVIHSADVIAHALNTEPVEESLESMDSSVLAILCVEMDELTSLADQILESVEELEEDTY